MREVGDLIRDLDNDTFGITEHWHKRIIGGRLFAADQRITGRSYAEVERLATEAGWTFGICHAGRLVGECP
ncbi:hypothetical protein [Streptomyces sp. NPDC054883]